MDAQYAIDDYKRHQQNLAEREHQDQIERDYNDYLEQEHRDIIVTDTLESNHVLSRFLMIN